MNIISVRLKSLDDQDINIPSECSDSSGPFSFVVDDDGPLFYAVLQKLIPSFSRESSDPFVIEFFIVTDLVLTQLFRNSCLGRV